jgi:hypothetical protein
MISPESFTVEWINSHRKDKRFSRINPPVLEKMIRALALLEALAINNLNFTFKGGTSLILLLLEPRRFSVDIDMLTEHSREELEVVFNKIIESGAFTKWEIDEPRSYKAGVPKAHYLFHFDSKLNKQAGYILLDVLFEKHQYPLVNMVPIRSSWLNLVGEPTEVEVRSIDSILGDKLTAFAPNTTGVLYGKEKSLEIVKQLLNVDGRVLKLDYQTYLWIVNVSNVFLACGTVKFYCLLPVDRKFILPFSVPLTLGFPPRVAVMSLFVCPMMNLDATAFWCQFPLTTRTF